MAPVGCSECGEAWDRRVPISHGLIDFGSSVWLNHYKATESIKPPAMKKNLWTASMNSLVRSGVGRGTPSASENTGIQKEQIRNNMFPGFLGEAGQVPCS